MGVRRLVQGVAHHLVPGLADMAGAIHLTGLENSWGQPEVSGNGLLVSEARGIIDRGLEGETDDRPDTGHAHEAAAHRVTPSHLRQPSVQTHLLPTHDIAGFEQRFYGKTQFWSVCQQVFNSCRESASMHGTQLEPMDFEQAADRQFDGHDLIDEFLAR